MARGFERAPRWAWVVMVSGLAAIAVLSYFAVNRPAPPTFDGPAVAAEQGEAGPTRVLVVGDSYTGGSDEGGQGAAGWPALASQALRGEGRDVVMDVKSAGGSGYAQPNGSGRTFADLAAASGNGYDVVVVFGSRNDRGGAAGVEGAAEAVYRELMAKSPKAKLLVVGPPWVNPRPPAFITADRDGVAAAARRVGAAFVDPLADGWFADRPELIGGDGVHPTDAGHQYMVERILPPLRSALDAVTAGQPAG